MKASPELMSAFLSLSLIFSAATAAEGDAGPEAAAEGLHAALVAGDESAVRGLLAGDVLIFESGGVEASLEEYAHHHMSSDMAFMKSVQREVLDRRVLRADGQAVVATQSRLTGSFRDRPVDVDSTETLVLENRQGAWTITHIHWSSRARKGDDE